MLSNVIRVLGRAIVGKERRAKGQLRLEKPLKRSDIETHLLSFSPSEAVTFVEDTHCASRMWRLEIRIKYRGESR